MLKGLLGKLSPFAMREAGAVLNAKNRAAITLAYRQLKVALRAAGVDPDLDEESAADTKESLREVAGFTVGDLSLLLSAALNADNPAGYERRRIVDLFDDRLVYQENWSGPFYAVTYGVSDDGLVSFGASELVIRKVDYISPGASTLNASEAGDLALSSDVVPLVEAAVTDNGQTQIKLIAPGWGSSGYYPADVLRRDGPIVFKAGTKMFWDHPTPAEESARPEGSLDRWAATLLEDARFDPQGPKGAGLYAMAEVRTDYRQPVNDLALKGLGVSIRASGRARAGSIEGKNGPIVETITSARSVDFVTAAGAGGAVLALFEAARGGEFREAGTLSASIEENDTMVLSTEDRAAIAVLVSEAVTAAVAPLREANAALRDANDLREAERFVNARLARIAIPPAVKTRIAPEIARLFERDASGAIDATKLTEAVNTRASAEIAYLRSIGVPGMSGKIEGFGDSAPLTESTNNGGGTDDASEAALAGIFAGWGLDDKAAKIAARGRLK